MPRDLIRLVSKGKTKDGKATRTFYTTSKNKQANANKISKKKFDPRAFNTKTNKNGAHVDFTEEKMK